MMPTLLMQTSTVAGGSSIRTGRDSHFHAWPRIVWELTQVTCLPPGLASAVHGNWNVLDHSPACAGAIAENTPMITAAAKNTRYLKPRVFIFVYYTITKKGRCRGRLENARRPTTSPYLCCHHDPITTVISLLNLCGSARPVPRSSPQIRIMYGAVSRVDSHGSDPEERISGPKLPSSGAHQDRSALIAH